ncbi:MAG TPA: IS66 family insertion sequence hypothetical protein [Butyrivibrio sp.]|nr:IS66 family insertion sequence hypothetical protein [Butyrivibrio sp.]
MDQIIHNARFAQWLSDNGIKEKAYYYWLHKFRKQAYAQMHLPSTEVSDESDISFADVSIPDRRTTGIPKVTEETTVEAIRPVAVIKNADMTIALTNEVSDSLLSHILRELSHA